MRKEPISFATTITGMKKIKICFASRRYCRGRLGMNWDAVNV